MQLPRLRDSYERLHAFIESKRHTPFAWGSNDCCLFAADGILAQTGVDLAAKWRGYTTDREALTLIEAAGGLRGFASGLIERKVGFVRRGEIVLVQMNGREAFALVSGNGHYCGPGPNGLVFRPLSEAIAAFGF